MQPQCFSIPYMSIIYAEENIELQLTSKYYNFELLHIQIKLGPLALDQEILQQYTCVYSKIAKSYS